MLKSVKVDDLSISEAVTHFIYTMDQTWSSDDFILLLTLKNALISALLLKKSKLWFVWEDVYERLGHFLYIFIII